MIIILKLYLFQVSKNKAEELGTKLYYLQQANAVAKNLENLYNIKIKGRYLIFILPKINANPEFKNSLESKNFFYIYFNIDTDEFYKKKMKKYINLISLNLYLIQN